MEEEKGEAMIACDEEVVLMAINFSELVKLDAD